MVLGGRCSCGPLRAVSTVLRGTSGPAGSPRVHRLVVLRQSLAPAPPRVRARRMLPALPGGSNEVAKQPSESTLLSQGFWIRRKRRKGHRGNGSKRWPRERVRERAGQRPYHAHELGLLPPDSEPPPSVSSEQWRLQHLTHYCFSFTSPLELRQTKRPVRSLEVRTAAGLHTHTHTQREREREEA
ncbi:hypothetical protein VUR80DRAFT_5791 [Thermomyces stellatus]